MASQTEEIKQKIDIVELVGEYVKMNQSGSNWKGRCPFHAEKTPSFMVSRDKQIWHCFGCGEGGDIFTFIQKIEGLEFPEALRLLGDRAGVVIERQDPAVVSQRNRLIDVHRFVTNYYHKVLTDSNQAQAARDYLAQRGIDQVAIDTWQLGYAPDSWDQTSKILQQKGFTEQEIFLAGLSIQRDKRDGFYDRFRGRLMFPICDHQGYVVGFSARSLDPEAKEAKYINTPQTPLYNKSAVLLGLDKAKDAIRTTKEVVVVEGNVDVLTPHQFGEKNVVAPCGTALTDAHARLLKRYAPTVVLSFDQDDAGLRAAEKGIATALSNGLQVRVMTLADGQDPDSFIRAEGIDAWKERVAAAQPVMEYYFSGYAQPEQLQDATGKKQAAAKLLPVISALADAVEQNHWLQRLADVLGISEQILREELQKMKRQPQAAAAAQPAASVKPPQSTPQQRQEERFMALIFGFPMLLPMAAQQFEPQQLTTERLQGLYNNLVVYYNEQHNGDTVSADFFNTFTEHLSGDTQQYANQLTLLGQNEAAALTTAEATRALQHLMREIKKHSLKTHIQQLSDHLKQAEARGDTDAVNDLSSKFSLATSQLRHLK